MAWLSAPPTAAASGPLLRDIHLPPPPSWWPPAPGWWALAALCVLALLGAWLLLRRSRRTHQARARVLAELDQLAARHALDHDDAALASGLHQLLRRVARRWDPASAQARGEAWHAAIARVPVDAATLQKLSALEQALYRPQPLDVAATVDAVRRWLTLALRRPVGSVSHG
jgi:hypothetical protein